MTREKAQDQGVAQLTGMPSSSMVEPQSPWPALWRPNLETDVGRPLNVEDRVANSPYVVAALGRACALSRDMEKWRRLDDMTLVLLAMRLAITVSLRQFLQKVFDFGLSFDARFLRRRRKNVKLALRG